jgi:hypothetical protein
MRYGRTQGRIIPVRPTRSTTQTIELFLSGSIVSAGEITKSVSINLIGVQNLSGALTKETSKFFAGSISSGSTLSKEVSKALGGNIAPSGAILRAISKSLFGSITPTGIVGLDSGDIASINVALTIKDFLIRLSIFPHAQLSVSDRNVSFEIRDMDIDLSIRED